MTVQIANTPVSWGVHYPLDPRNDPWEQVLDGIAAAGYRQTELGALGYVPEDPALLREALDSRGLTPTAMYVFQPAHADRAAQADVVERSRRSCELLAAVGGQLLVIIDERNPLRIPTAGRSGDAQRIDDAGFEQLIADMTGLGEVAVAAGITPVLHPHVAGYVEFEDEIARAAEALAGTPVKLCIDTGHCAYAGIDAAALYRRFADRVAHLHFKDVDGDVLARVVAQRIDFDTAMLEGVFCPIGQGVTDFEAFATALDEHGYDGTATVEQDHEPSDPGKAAKALAGAVASLEFLRRSGLAAD
ncbi:MAG TPA: TIM barrel protein [Conexibacter sp.]|jgi:inosose dehydratase|nr:TIM barrel protein [Conexibacter sp.]